MNERRPFFDLAGVAMLLGMIAGSAIGGAIGLWLGVDYIVLATGIGILTGGVVGYIGERRAARRRRSSSAEGT